MTAIAVTVFIVAFVLIAMDRIPRIVAALGDAGVVLALGVVDAHDAFSGNIPASTGTSSFCCSA